MGEPMTWEEVRRRVLRMMRDARREEASAFHKLSALEHAADAAALTHALAAAEAEAEARRERDHLLAENERLAAIVAMAGEVRDCVYHTQPMSSVTFAVADNVLRLARDPEEVFSHGIRDLLARLRERKAQLAATPAQVYNAALADVRRALDGEADR